MPSWAFLSVPVVRPETTPVSAHGWGSPRPGSTSCFPRQLTAMVTLPPLHGSDWPRASVSPVSFSTAGVGGRVPETWPPTSRGRQPTAHRCPVALIKQAMEGRAQNPAVLPSGLWHSEGSPEPAGQTAFTWLAVSGHLCCLGRFLSHSCGQTAIVGRLGECSEADAQGGSPWKAELQLS